MWGTLFSLQWVNPVMLNFDSYAFLFNCMTRSGPRFYDHHLMTLNSNSLNVLNLIVCCPAGLWKYAQLVQLVPFLFGQERNFSLLVLGQGLHLALSKTSVQIMRYIFFLFLSENICCGYSSEVFKTLLMSTHNICFLWEIRKKVNFQASKSWLDMDFNHLFVCQFSGK